MTREQLLDVLAAMAGEAEDPLKEIEQVRLDLRERVFRAALEASEWSSHAAAAKLGRRTSTIQSALETHHHDLERERLQRAARVRR